jgi:hypothetical protein
LDSSVMIMIVFANSKNRKKARLISKYRLSLGRLIIMEKPALKMSPLAFTQLRYLVVINSLSK